jgi:hypothetical protein
LEEFYTDELYPLMKEFFSEFYAEYGFEPSPPPEFVLSEDETDIDNRTFVYYLDLSEVEGINGKDTRPKKESGKSGGENVNVEDIDFDDEDGDGSGVGEGGKGKDKGREKEVLEGGEGGGKEKSENVRLKELEIRDKELELKIKEEERKAKESETRKLAMELLRDGIIDKEEFKKLVGL